jgi:hypothetical protein
MTTKLAAAEYRQLISAALAAATDADTVDPAPRTLFTPDRHRQALDPDATVVRGARGAGKTVWFKALQDRALRALAATDYQLERLKSVDPLVGYGTELRPGTYPGPGSLRQLLADQQQLTGRLLHLESPNLSSLTLSTGFTLHAGKLTF